MAREHVKKYRYYLITNYSRVEKYLLKYTEWPSVNYPSRCKKRAIQMKEIRSAMPTRIFDAKWLPTKNIVPMYSK